MNETVWHMEEKEFCTERLALKKALYSEHGSEKQTLKAGRFSQGCQ